MSVLPVIMCMRSAIDNFLLLFEIWYIIFKSKLSLVKLVVNNCSSFSKVSPILMRYNQIDNLAQFLQLTDMGDSIWLTGVLL